MNKDIKRTDKTTYTPIIRPYQHPAIKLFERIGCTDYQILDIKDIPEEEFEKLKNTGNSMYKNKHLKVIVSNYDPDELYKEIQSMAKEISDSQPNEDMGLDEYLKY